MTVSTQTLSVLSLDAYGREINAGLIDPTLGTAGLQGNIGSISYLGSSRDFLPPTGSGFYATVYSVNGEIVIAFRGTDGDGDFAEDGLFMANQVGPQTELAFQLYELVHASYPTSNIVLTGHSLGGALAGTVAALRGVEAVLFDNVRYEGTANTIYQTCIDAEPPPPPGFIELFYGEGNTPSAPDFTDIHTTAIWGEVAQATRLGQTTAQTYYDVGDSWLLSPGELHAQALLAIRLYMQTSGDWKPAGELLWDSFFSDDLAASVGIAAVNGNPANGVMHDMIAYSTIGAGPFGGSAASSFRSDANTLGRVLNIDEEFDGQWLADTAVGFATLLARSPTSFGTGVLDFTAGVEPGSGWLSLDLSPETWTFGEELEGLAAAAREAFVQTAFEPMEAAGLMGFLEFSGAAELTHSARMAVGETVFVAATTRSQNFTLIIGTDRGETILGGVGHEIIVGSTGEGNVGDTIDGGAGADLIVGTDFGDTLSGGEDPDGYIDFAWGRGGADTFDSFYFASGGEGNDTFERVSRAAGGSEDDTFVDIVGLAWGGAGSDTFQFSGTGVYILLVEDQHLTQSEFIGADLSSVSWNPFGYNLVNVDELDVLTVNGRSFVGGERVEKSYSEYYVEDDLFRHSEYILYNSTENVSYVLGNGLLYIGNGLAAYDPWNPQDFDLIACIEGFQNGDFGISFDENDDATWDIWNVTQDALFLESEDSLLDTSGIGRAQFDGSLQQWSDDWMVEYVNTPPPPMEEYI